MAYLDTKRRPSFGSMAAVVAIHGAVGAALVFGLTVSGVIEKREIFAGFTVDPLVPPPPPPRPPETKQKVQPANNKITVPDPILPLVLPTSAVEVTTMIIPPQPPVQPGRGEMLTKVFPTPGPTFTPAGAKPRNDPQRWVTTDDYRGNWIRQEMMGKARFRLEIAADGRVTNCTITGSSGHPELDAATCALVTRRAKFQPARGGEGEPVAGSYANAIDWQLPE